MDGTWWVPCIEWDPLYRKVVPVHRKWNHPCGKRQVSCRWRTSVWVQMGHIWHEGDCANMLMSLLRGILPENDIIFRQSYHAYVYIKSRWEWGESISQRPSKIFHQSRTPCSKCSLCTFSGLPIIPRALAGSGPRLVPCSSSKTRYQGLITRFQSSCATNPQIRK